MSGVIRRNLSLLFASQALSLVAIQISIVHAPIITFLLSGSAFLAGLAASIIWIGRLGMVYQSGRLMDKIGRRPVLLLGAALLTIGLVIAALASSYSVLPLFIAGLVVLGFGIGATQQNRVAVADMYPASKRGKAVGVLLAGSVVGSLAAPFVVKASELVASLYSLDQHTVSLLLASVAIAGSMPLIVAVRPDPREIAANLRSYYPDEETELDGAKNSTVGEMHRPSLLYFPILTSIIAITIMQGDMTMMMTLVSLHLSETGMVTSLITAVITIHVIGMFGFSWLFGSLADKIGRRMTLVIGGLMMAAGCILTPISEFFVVLAVGIFLIGLGWSATMTTSTTVISDVSPPHFRGKMIGFSDTFSGMASVLFPLWGGVTLSISDFATLGFLAFLTTIPAIALSYMLKEFKPGNYAYQVQAIVR